MVFAGFGDLLSCSNMRSKSYAAGAGSLGSSGDEPKAWRDRHRRRSQVPGIGLTIPVHVFTDDGIVLFAFDNRCHNDTSLFSLQHGCYRDRQLPIHSLGEPFLDHIQIRCDKNPSCFILQQRKKLFLRNHICDILLTHSII